MHLEFERGKKKAQKLEILAAAGRSDPQVAREKTLRYELFGVRGQESCWKPREPTNSCVGEVSKQAGLGFWPGS